MRNPIGIIIQDINNQIPIDISDVCYNGVSKYYSFTADIKHSNRSYAYLINNSLLKTDKSGMMDFISSLSNYKAYLDMCHQQKIDTRSLFLFSDLKETLWEGNVPDCTFLGYEFVYKNFSDPEYIYILNTATEFVRFKRMLNSHGLFNSKKDAEEFGRQLYSTFEYIEDEMSYADTLVVKVCEMK